MTPAPLEQLARALDATEHLIAAVREEQWTAATPCSEWNVRELVNHVVAGNHMFASILRDAPATAPPPPPPDSELLDAYHSSAAGLLAAFGQPGVLERVFMVPFGSVPGIVALHLRITEVLVHGWDLARASGQRAEFPADLAEQALDFSRGKLGNIPSGRQPFQPPQPVADDAPAIDRLAALLGRPVAS